VGSAPIAKGRILPYSSRPSRDVDWLLWPNLVVRVHLHLLRNTLHVSDDSFGFVLKFDAHLVILNTDGAGSPYQDSLLSFAAAATTRPRLSCPRGTAVVNFCKTYQNFLRNVGKLRTDACSWLPKRILTPCCLLGNAATPT
jgi:hypothetical protein